MKIYKKLCWPLLITTVALLLQVACNPSKPKQTISAQNDEIKQSIRINISVEPSSLDPAKASVIQSITVVRMLFDGLTRINKENRVEMALAENVIVSEDQKTFTFMLRDAKWTNGDTIRANDFLYAWRRVIDPNVPADNAFHLYSIKNAKAIKSGNLPIEELGVKVIDEKTLQVELENPTPYFLELVSYPVFCPINEKVDRATPNWADNVETYVSNGPFSLVEWRHQDSIRLEKNPTYWDNQSVNLDEISLFILNEETELSMFENKELDWAGSPLSILPIDALGKLHADKILKRKAILGTYFLRINTENPLLQSQSVRQALSLSVNREELVGHALAGSQIAASGFVPEVLGLREQSYFQGDNEHKAMKLFENGLEEMGMMRAEIPELEILLVNCERNQRIAQMLQERWQRVLGLKVRLNAMEAKSYYEKLYKGDFQIASGSWMADYNDPISFLEIFKNKLARTNQTHWENEEYARLIEASETEMDPAARMKMLAKCEQLLLQDMPIIPLFHYNMLFIRNQNLNDVFISNLGVMDLRWAKWDSVEQGIR